MVDFLGCAGTVEETAPGWLILIKDETAVMTDEMPKDEVDELLSRAGELIEQESIDWRKVGDLLEKLHSVVREAEQRKPESD